MTTTNDSTVQHCAGDGRPPMSVPARTGALAALGLLVLLSACSAAGNAAPTIDTSADAEGGAASAGGVSPAAGSADHSRQPEYGAAGAQTPPAAAQGLLGTAPVPELEIVGILPKDAIPALDNPKYWPAAEADQHYDAGDRVIGVSIDGDSRAYSVPFLSGREIVNDTVGGRPISVTW